MRVAFLVYDLDGHGGMQRQAMQLAAKLIARGLDVRVVSTAAPRDLPVLAGRPAPGLEGTPVVRLPTTRSPLFEAAARAWLAVQGGADVLYAVGANAGLHAVRIGARTNAPVVVKYACAGAHGDVAWAARTQGALALLGRAARHVCISQALREEALAAGLPDARLVTLPNGVDLAAWSRPVEPARSPWAGGRVLLFVGRLVAQKRVDVLLEALALVGARAADARLLIAGDGPLRAALVAQARSLGITERVAFLGQRDDVLTLHRASRALVLPSEGEGLPNAVLEALASGTPVVATDVPGTREVARDGVEALLVPAGDARALADAMFRLIDDPALGARLAAAGRARVAEAFDLERVADRYVALLQDVARERAPPRRGVPERIGGLVRTLRRRRGT